MSNKISNSIINIGSRINGSISNTVYQNIDHDELINEIDTILKKNHDTFNDRELSQLQLAKEELKSGNIESAKSTLRYFKTAVEDIAKMTLTNVLSGFILRL